MNQKKFINLQLVKTNIALNFLFHKIQNHSLISIKIFITYFREKRPLLSFMFSVKLDDEIFLFIKFQRNISLFKDPDLHYEVFTRTKTRECNLGLEACMTGNIERVPLLEQHCAYWAQWEPWPVVRRDSVSKNSYFIIRS